MSPICLLCTPGVYAQTDWCRSARLIAPGDTSQQCHQVGGPVDAPESHLGSFLWFPSLIRTSLRVTDGWYNMEKTVPRTCFCFRKRLSVVCKHEIQDVWQIGTHGIPNRCSLLCWLATLDMLFPSWGLTEPRGPSCSVSGMPATWPSGIQPRKENPQTSFIPM